MIRYISVKETQEERRKKKGWGRKGGDFVLKCTGGFEENKAAAKNTIADIYGGTMLSLDSLGGFRDEVTGSWE